MIRANTLEESLNKALRMHAQAGKSAPEIESLLREDSTCTENFVIKNLPEGISYDHLIEVISRIYMRSGYTPLSTKYDPYWRFVKEESLETLTMTQVGDCVYISAFTRPLQKGDREILLAKKLA